MVREPARHGGSAVGRLSFGPMFAHMGKNKLAYAGLMAGCALNVMSIYALLGWYPTLFVRVHHWTSAEIGRDIGIFGVPGGITSAITSGFIIAWLARRGRQDAPVLLVLAAAPVFLIVGVASCLLPNPDRGLCRIRQHGDHDKLGVIRGSDRAEPDHAQRVARSGGGALYTLIAGIVAVGFGPTSVGLLTRSCFRPRPGRFGVWRWCWRPAASWAGPPCWPAALHSGGRQSKWNCRREGRFADPDYRRRLGRHGAGARPGRTRLPRSRVRAGARVERDWGRPSPSAAAQTRRSNGSASAISSAPDPNAPPTCRCCISGPVN